jgi:hypothetical protein
LPSASPALGSCYRFNGGAVVLPFTTATQPGDEWSIELWAKTETYTAPAHIAGSGNDLSAGSFRFTVYSGPSSQIGASLVYASGPGGEEADAGWPTPVQSLTAWHHYVYVHSKSAGTASLYVDGHLVDSTVVPSGNFVPGSSPLYVGKHQLSGPFQYAFFGLVDELSVYKRSLPATEILEHYEVGSGTVVSVPGNFSTIQAAIDSASSLAKTTICVAPGTYAGPINLLGKPIRLVGTGGAAVTTISGTGGQSQSVIRAISGEPAISLIKGFTITGGTTGSPLPQNPLVIAGGGILMAASSTSIEACILEQNNAAFGGGAYLYQHAGSVTGCTVRQNTAQAYGGGIQLYCSSTTVTDCTFTGNSAVTAGGGLHIVRSAPSLVECTVTGNRSFDRGGGISWDPDLDPSLLTIQQCQITGNDADGTGGGLFVYPTGIAGETRLIGTTICWNALNNAVGAYQADSASQVCDCRADLNGDSLVNGIDLATILSSWDTSSTIADLTGDGIVGGSDLAIVLAAWGTCPSN